MWSLWEESVGRFVRFEKVGCGQSDGVEMGFGVWEVLLWLRVGFVLWGGVIPVFVRIRPSECA